MNRHTIREVIGAALAGSAFAFILLTPMSAAAGVNPPCQVTGHLEPGPGTVTAVFTVAATCREVSVLSWLAPDAHAGTPQTLYDRKSQNDVAPGDYIWTITRPPDECFQQSDLRVPGHNVDAILGGTQLCQPPPTTTTTPTTTVTATSSTSISLAPSTTTTSTRRNPGTTSTTTTGPSTPTTGPPSSTELPTTGADLATMTGLALGIIGAGRWVEVRGKRRRR